MCMCVSVCECMNVSVHMQEYQGYLWPMMYVTGIHSNCIHFYISIVSECNYCTFKSIMPKEPMRMGNCAPFVHSCPENNDTQCT